jgi:hypothetical protein
MKRSVRVESYFSLPADLAAEFREWPEFLTGVGYHSDTVCMHRQSDRIGT